MKQLELDFSLKCFEPKPIGVRLTENQRKRKNTRASQKKRSKLSPTISNLVLQRDKKICQYCGGPVEKHAVDPNKYLTFDHFHSYCEGGSNAPENIVVSCETCNQIKGNVVFEDLFTAQKTILALRGLGARVYA